MKHIDRRKFLVTSGVAAAWAALAPKPAWAKSNQCRVMGLKVDYIDRPLGLENAQPRFFWRLESEARNVRQSAYRILVATSEAAVRSGVGDMWDSGQVRSRKSIEIRYQGKRLKSRQRCWWAVQVWDQNGQACGPSEPTWWEMGLLDPGDWSAQWLAVENAAGKADRQAGLHWIWGSSKLGPRVRLFRSNFTLPKAAKRGSLYAIVYDIRMWSQISRIWIDGAPVAGPGEWQDVNGQAELCVLDPTLGAIEAGEHTIAVEVRTAEGFALLEKSPLVHALALLGRFELEDGALFHLRSGPDWKTGVTEDPQWTATGYDDREWESARSVPLEAYQPIALQPAMHLRREFRIELPITQARLYATALGAYEAHINGQRVGDGHMAPEVSQYAKRARYRVFDVTKLLQAGDNTLGLLVGDGWYGSFDGRFAWAPPPRRAIAQLEIRLADGSRQVIGTGPGWKTAESAIRRSEIKTGEFYDARMEQSGWDRVGFDARKWSEAELIDPPSCELSAQVSPPIRVTEIIKPTAVVEPRSGVYIFDFGQHFAGWARLRCQGPRGTRIELRFAEIVNAAGEIEQPYMNTGNPKVDIYILRGDPKGETFEPHFTHRSFRYMEISGSSVPLTLQSIDGLAVHSDLKSTATLRVSDPLIERIWRNMIWTERSNMVGTITDCASREMRSWMNTSMLLWDGYTFHWDAAAFSRRYMENIRDQQADSGAFAMQAVIPRYNSALFLVPGAVPGWGDNGIIMPWTAWKRYGDTDIIEQNWTAMDRHLKFILEHNPDHVRRHQRGMDWPEWLSLDQMIPDTGLDSTPKDAIGTAFWAYVANMMADMAEATDRREDAVSLRSLAQRVTEAYNREFVQPDGKVGNGTQTDYVLALKFGLLGEPMRRLAAQRLADDIKGRGVSLTTGIVGTHFLLDALTDTGHADLAYGLLLRTDFPSWGHMIRLGATTTWETWNGEQAYKDASGRIHRMTMSRNHPEFGSIAGFMFRRIAGIEEASPGFETVTIRPVLDPRVQRGGGDYDSISGRISTDWVRHEDGSITIDLTIPANVTARVYLPAPSGKQILEGHEEIGSNPDVVLIHRTSQEAIVEVGSGSFRFEVIS